MKGSVAPLMTAVRAPSQRTAVRLRAIAASCGAGSGGGASTGSGRDMRERNQSGRGRRESQAETRSSLYLRRPLREERTSRERMDRHALVSRNLIAYLASRFCAASAAMMLRAGIAWHVFALTGSPFHLGLVGLVQFAPALALMLVGGALADAYDRRRI